MKLMKGSSRNLLTKRLACFPPISQSSFHQLASVDNVCSITRKILPNRECFFNRRVKSSHQSETQNGFIQPQKSAPRNLVFFITAFH